MDVVNTCMSGLFLDPKGDSCEGLGRINSESYIRVEDNHSLKSGGSPSRGAALRQFKFDPP